MKVLIPVWRSRVAPVFDTVKRVCLFNLENGQCKLLNELEMDSDNPSSLLIEIKNLNCNVLICGAIPFRYERFLIENNWTVIPFISGEVTDVMKHYSAGLKDWSSLKMPGCQNREQRGRGRERGRGRGRNRNRRGSF